MTLSHDNKKGLSWNDEQKLQVSGYPLGKPSSSTHMGILLYRIPNPHVNLRQRTVRGPPYLSIPTSGPPASTATSQLTSKCRIEVFKTCYLRAFRAPYCSSRAETHASTSVGLKSTSQHAIYGSDRYCSMVNAPIQVGRCMEGALPGWVNQGKHPSQISLDRHLPWTSTIRIRSPAGQSAFKNCWSVLSSVLRLQHYSPPSTTRNPQTAIARPSSGAGIQSWFNSSETCSHTDRSSHCSP